MVTTRWPWQGVGGVAAVLLLLALVFWFISAPSRFSPADGWLHIDGFPGLKARLAVQPDPQEILDWERVQNDAGFQPLPEGKRPVFFSTGMWFRIDLTVPPSLLGQAAWLRVVPALIWEVEWHTDQGMQGRSGMSVPMSEQPIPSAPTVIRVALDRSEVRLYLRVLTAAPQLTHLSLLSDLAFRREVQRNTLVQALFLGAMALMWLLTLLSWALTRQEWYRDCALYLGATMLFMLCVNGYLNTFVLTESPEWMARTSFASFMWSVAATLWFSLRALNIREHRPRLAHWIRVFSVGALAGSALGLHPDWIAPVSAVMWPLYLVMGLGLLVLSLLEAWRLRTAQSLVVFLAYLAFNLFEKFPLLAMLGGFPVTAWTTDVAKLGLLSQMLLTHVQWGLQLRERAVLEKQALAATVEATTERSQRGDLLQFLGMFGHEVRTPLTIIHATTESLEMLPGAEQPAYRKRYQRIRHAVERLNVLSREALSRERMEASGWIPRFRRVEVPALLEDVLWMQQVQMPDEGGGLEAGEQVMAWSVGGVEQGALRLVLPSEWQPLEADPDMLTMVLGNLLDNARKYAHPGSEVRLVWQFIQADRRVPHYRIDVSSQGVELTEAERERLFDKYWRRDEHRNVPGAGIGLHLVRHLVHIHHGRIRVDSLPGGWTRFRLDGPCRLSAH